jgi:hypothetical protein
MLYVNVIASTASPAIVPKAITPSPTLEARTELTVIYPEGKTYRIDVFRQSSSKGLYSREIYTCAAAGGKARRLKKDRRKYKREELPWPPEGSSEQVVRGVKVWTPNPTDQNELERVIDSVTGQFRDLPQ